MTLYGRQIIELVDVDPLVGLLYRMRKLLSLAGWVATLAGLLL